MSQFFCPDYCLGINSLSNHAAARVRCAAGPKADPASAADTSSHAVATKPTLRTRLAQLALALALLFVMFSGERWVLEHSTAGADELIVATCAANAAFGTGGPADPCASAGTSTDEEASSK